MIAFAASIWVVVGLILLRTWQRQPEKISEIFKRFRSGGRIFVGVVPMALLAAGFLAPMVPSELVGRWLGEGAGSTGIFIGMLAGWCLPIPPVIFYPVIAVLLKAGAGLPQLVALIVAWSVFALHRTLPMELPLMGGYFVSLRLMSSIFLPIVAGFSAMGIVALLGLGQP
jgi:hypothetical protein